MREKKKIHKPYRRKIHINDEEWTYRVTTRSVHICSPDCTKKWKFEGKFGFRYMDDYDDDDFYLGYGDIPSTNPLPPSDVKRIIQKRILGEKISR